ncbi:hypothetical protein KSS87_020477 [Heliosperma pusillum]|nr:hypothetical protein KSS87_020477 [Heliosperma pusillum]
MAKVEVRWISSSGLGLGLGLGLGCNPKSSLVVPDFGRPILVTPRWRPISLKTKTRAFGKKNEVAAKDTKQEEEVIEEEELPWIEEKALDLVEFSGSVSQAIPGPRVGNTSFPWFLALPLAYLGFTFVLALFQTFNKFTSPKALRRRRVTKNVHLIKSIDDLFNQHRHHLQQPLLKDLTNKTGFSTEDILRKYIRYALNEKPFNPDIVADLIQLRKASMLTDSQVAHIFNDISTRIVKDKGPVVMDASGYSEKGFKRKLAVQALFGKVFYLSELIHLAVSSMISHPDFHGACFFSEDADKLRIHTLSDAGDMESLEKMIEGGSDSGDNSEI